MGAFSRARVWLGTAFVCGAMLSMLLPIIPAGAQEDEETAVTPSPSPPKAKEAKSKAAGRKKKKSPSPSPKKTPTPKPSPLKAKKSEPEDEETPTPSPKKKSETSRGEDKPSPSAGAGNTREEDPDQPSPARKKAKKSGDEETPTPTAKSRKKTAQEGGEASPSSKSKSKKSQSKKKTTKTKKKQTPAPDKTPKPAKTPSPDLPDAELPQPEQSSSASVSKAVPTTTPSDPVPPADITVQKSGLQQDEGFEPPPPPPPSRGFWNSLFGRRSAPVNYRYLSRDLIDAIRNAPVQRGRWKFIVVHNSGTRQGNARAFDYYHRKVRRMQNGLAYHFVIGNGTSSGDGQIEIGDRWRRQINGGHVHSDYLNNIALGICLVGDFNRDQPTRAQLDACEELIRYLQTRCGKSEGHLAVVRPHREVNPPRWATDCPGDAFPYVWFRRFRD